jgi:hypothetical protein
LNVTCSPHHISELLIFGFKEQSLTQSLDVDCIYPIVLLLSSGFQYAISI